MLRHDRKKVLIQMRPKDLRVTSGFTAPQ